MEMAGKGEVSAYAYHLKQRVILIILQVYEDLMGMAETALKRSAAIELAKSWFDGTLSLEPFVKFGAALSPDDEDNMHGGRLGTVDGYTWVADVERA